MRLGGSVEGHLGSSWFCLFFVFLSISLLSFVSGSCDLKKDVSSCSREGLMGFEQGSVSALVTVVVK